jgi:hypothetical protein
VLFQRLEDLGPALAAMDIRAIGEVNAVAEFHVAGLNNNPAMARRKKDERSRLDPAWPGIVTELSVTNP